MIVINLLKISNDRTTMDVSVSTSAGETIESVSLWTDKSFKNYDAALDFTSKLAQTSEDEVFSITASEVDGDVFDGIFFLEFTTTDVTPPSTCTGCNGQIALGVVAEFTRFQECILEKVLKLNTCDGEIFGKGGCGDSKTGDIINTKVILDALKYALQSGFYNEAITFKKQLDKFCTEKCWTCDDLTDPTYLSGLNYCTIDNTLILQ